MKGSWQSCKGVWGWKVDEDVLLWTSMSIKTIKRNLIGSMIESGGEPHDQGPSHINYCMTYSRRTRLVLLSEGNQYWRTIQLGLSANYWTCIGSISGYWDGSFHVLHKMSVCAKWKHVIFDCEVREIMHLVASVCPSIRPSVCPSIHPSVYLCSHCWTVWPRLCRVQQRAIRVITSLGCLSVCL